MIHNLLQSVILQLIQKYNRKNYSIFSNSSIGIHGNGNVTYPTAQKIRESYIFVIFNKDGTSIETATSSKHGIDKEITSRAIGVVTDQSHKIKDPVNVQLLGAQPGTYRVRTAEKIKAGDLITSNDTGKACSFTNQAGGHYYVYGISITNAEKDSFVEFIATPGLEKTKN